MKKRLLLLDNKDSFTYNLVESIRLFPNLECQVLTPHLFEKEKSNFHFDGMIISPGPGLPQDSKHLLRILNKHVGRIPILGVCLGLQALLVNQGVSLRKMNEPLHGRASFLQIIDSSDLLYKGLDMPIKVGHYHSWYALPQDCPKEFIPTAVDSEGRLMSIRHKSQNIWAVQFHPESYLCPQGDKLLANFLGTL